MDRKSFILGMFASRLMGEFDIVSFQSLMMATAASVLDQLAHMSPDIERDVRPEQGSGTILSDKLDYDAFNIQSAVWSQVMLLKGFAEFVIENRGFFGILGRLEAQLIADALNAYQEYKTKITALNEEREGQGFGRRTGFYQANFAEDVPALLALYEK